MHWQLSEIYGGIAQRCRGIFDHDAFNREDHQRDIGEPTGRWRPRWGQDVLVVGICAASTHAGLDADVVGCQGRVSGIEQGIDHPYEVLIPLSEQVYLYGRFASTELAPLNRAAKAPDKSSRPALDGVRTIGIEPG